MWHKDHSSTTEAQRDIYGNEAVYGLAKFRDPW